MNNNIFSGKRFSEFFPIELICLQKRQFLYLLIIAGILTLIALLNTMGTYDDPVWIESLGFDPALGHLIIIYVILFFVFGCMSASIMWAEMKDKQGRLYTLMNPATMFEKFLAKFIIYVIIFIIAYIVSVCIAETVRYLVYNHLYPEAGVTPIYLSFSYPKEIVDAIWGLHSSVVNPFLFFSCLYLMLQSFFVLGSSIWPSRSFVKTFLIFGCLAGIYLSIAFWTGRELSEGKAGSPKWFRDYSYEIYYTFTITVTLTNWILAYCRIRETDIITTKR